MLLAVFIFCVFINTNAQKVKPKTSKINTKEFILSYAVTITGEKTDGIQQTYNGGQKTAFVKNDLVRLRLVSLMRVQSIYFNNKKGLTSKVASVVKESGKERTAMTLNAKEWKSFNKKNESIRCEIFKEDTLRILGQLCNKATLTSKDSSKITVYYLPEAKNNTLAAAEPLFASVPGLVMKYSIEIADKTLEYTAVELKFAPIAATVFNQPRLGYLKVKYNPNGSTIPVTPDEADDDNGTEEEETEMETPTGTTTPAATQPITPSKPPVITTKPPINY